MEGSFVVPRHVTCWSQIWDTHNRCLIKQQSFDGKSHRSSSWIHGTRGKYAPAGSSWLKMKMKQK